jgi:hypothetical protein
MMDMMDDKLDGNVAGGILHEIFPFEMTLVRTICANCGKQNVVGALAVYMHGMGTIMRCPSCDQVLIRVAHIKDNYCLDMQGVRLLQISLPA